MSGGRPTKFSPEMVEAAREYLEGGFLSGNEHKADALPSIVGLARRLGVSRSTIDNWGERDDEFLGITKEIQAEQERILLTNGLLGKFNAQIAKLLLGKYGYSDKVESENTHRFPELDGMTTEQLEEFAKTGQKP